MNYKFNFKSVIYSTIKKHYFHNSFIFIQLLVGRCIKTFFTTYFISFNNGNVLKKFIKTVFFCSLFYIVVILNLDNISKQDCLKVIVKYLQFYLLKYIIRTPPLLYYRVPETI